jgi:hypothetical protein
LSVSSEEGCTSGADTVEFSTLELPSNDFCALLGEENSEGVLRASPPAGRTDPVLDTFWALSDAKLKGDLTGTSAVTDVIAWTV